MDTEREKDRGRFSMRTWKMEVSGHRKRGRQRKIYSMRTWNMEVGGHRKRKTEEDLV